MPTMVRPKGLGKKIAFAILGIPMNMLYKKTQKQQERDNSIALRQSNTSSRIF
jgi:hypothetical protein